MQTEPEARPIEFTNGRAHFYSKNKVDTYLIFTLWLFWKNALIQKK